MPWCCSTNSSAAMMLTKTWLLIQEFPAVKGNGHNIDNDEAQYPLLTSDLTHYGLVRTYAIGDLCQYWFR